MVKVQLQMTENFNNWQFLYNSANCYLLPDKQSTFDLSHGWTIKKKP